MAGTHLLTLPEAATYLGVTPRFVRTLVHQRRVRFYRVDRLRFDPRDLDALVEASKVEPASKAGAR